MADEQLNKGQSNIEIDDLTIVSRNGSTSVSLLPFYTEIRIFESIYIPTLTADIVIVDPENIIENLPISGGETVHVKLRTSTFPDMPGACIQRSFVIASIVNRSLDNDRQQVYTLKLITPEMMRDSCNTINRAIPGEGGDTNTEAIAQKMFDDNIVVEGRYLPDNDDNSLIISGSPHDSSIQYISNSWSPFENMNYICKKIQASDVKGNDFFFYESNKNYYLTSLQHLILEGNNTYFEEYSYKPPSLPLNNRQEGNYNSLKLPDYFCRIEDIEIPRTINLLEGNISGYYSSNIQAYDMFNKKFKNFTLDIHDDFEEFVSTDSHNPVPKGISKDTTAYTSVKLLNSYTWNNPEQSQGLNEDALPSHYSSEAVRKQYINSFNDYQFLITVPGRTDIEVGRAIKLDYPQPKSKGTEDSYVEDVVLSGMYIITEIKHRINPVSYSMTLRITKNGVGKDLGGEA
jgi:hypothetical protein